MGRIRVREWGMRKVKGTSQGKSKRVRGRVRGRVRVSGKCGPAVVLQGSPV